MKLRRSFWRVIQICIICVVCLSACVRPEEGPSPFEGISTDRKKEQALPEGPVDGLEFSMIPDSEMVFSPSTVGFSISKVITSNGGYLADYAEMVGEVQFSGAEIVERVSREYSVHPRLLLAVIEMAGGWVSVGLQDGVKPYPIYASESAQALLFTQLSWAADTLNFGYYSRRVGGLPVIWTLDGVEIHISDSVTDASAAVQYFLAQIYGYQDWLMAAGPLGLYAQYAGLFGDPFADEVEDLIPKDLAQPEMALPFEEDWFYTSGPHSAWGSGAAWAALDFAPDEEGFGCYESDAFVTAAADGMVVRIGDGIVVQDLDGDGEEGTGWTILYMHIADDGKAVEGDTLEVGDPVGHSSCAGGPATGTHLHIARRYNGEWIPADQNIPFNLSGWISQGDGVEYDGKLARAQAVVEASGFPTDENKINR